MISSMMTYTHQDDFKILAELSHVLSAPSEVSCVRKIDYLYMQEILVLTKSYVRTCVRPFILADVKFLTSLNVQGIYN